MIWLRFSFKPLFPATRTRSSSPARAVVLTSAFFGLALSYTPVAVPAPAGTAHAVFARAELPPGFVVRADINDLYPVSRALKDISGFEVKRVLPGNDLAPRQVALAPYPDLPGWPVSVVGCTSPPVVADLDVAYPGLEVAFGTLSSGVNLYVLHADGTAMSGWPIDIGLLVASSPAAADIDGDGDLEIVAGDFGSNRVWAVHHDASAVSGWPIVVGANVRSSAALVDLDPDFPGLEVVIGVQDGKVHAWHHDGTPVPGWPAHAGNFVERSSPAVADVDGDGNLEVFVGSWFNGGAGSTGGVYGFDFDGTPLPEWPKLTSTHTSVVASPALADLDGDDDLEIVVGTYEQDARLFGWHHDGKIAAGWPQMIPRGVAYCSAMTSSPAVGDIDGDGDLEIVTGSTGECGTVYAWHHGGIIVAGWPVNTNAVVEGSSPVLGDVDGDEPVEIVVGSASGFTPYGCSLDEISEAYVFDNDGTIVDGWPVDLGVATPPHPALWDVDEDGDTEIIMCYAQTVYIWDAPASFDRKLLQWPFFAFDVVHSGHYRDPTLTGADEIETRPPAAQDRLAVWPNPNGSDTPVRIRYQLTVPSPVEITVFDVTGRSIHREFLGGQSSGVHEASWDRRDHYGNAAASGVYFVRLRTVRGEHFIKFTLIR